jgi:CBS domain-containing protein
MQALPQLPWRRCLESIIDFYPVTVDIETSVSDAVLLMANHGVSILVVLDSQVLGYLTHKHLMQLLGSGVDLKKTTISQVMQAVEYTVKLGEVENIATVFSVLNQHLWEILPVIDDYGQLIGGITPVSICQALAKLTQETSQEQAQTPLERLRLLLL